VAERRKSFFKTLSGRFLILTVIFVMLAEVLIFVPSIARFRADFMLTRLKQAQIAALTQLAAEDMVAPELEAELLANAEVYNVVLRRNEVRQLVLSSPIPHSPSTKPMTCGWRAVGTDPRCLRLSHRPGGPGDPGDRLSGAGGGHADRITMDSKPMPARRCSTTGCASWLCRR
jgi:hypothetical protein